ncbi:hypothetical protein BH10ACT1_BH10ACT1_31500 [soil metagenome]
MRHARFDIASLAVEGVPLPLRAAYLLVAETDDSDEPQWELVAYALEPAPIAQGLYRIDVTSLDGRTFDGEAALVRSVEGAHVLRGAGPLGGVLASDLD